MENRKDESTVDFVDIPTPTKDEPVIPKSIARVLPDSSATLSLKTNSATSPALAANSSVTPALIDNASAAEASPSPDNSRDSVTPTLDEKPDPDCPTPTLDEPVQSHNNVNLSVSEVKCKLFSNEVNGQSKVMKDVSEKEEINPEAGVTEKMVPNKSVPDQSKPSLNKSLSTSSNVGVSEDLKKKVVVKCNGELFICCECNHTGKGHHFEEHLMCHLIHKPYQCLYCKEAFATRKEIGKHLANLHKGKKLNCMLKALNKAKALMLKAKKSNSCEFLAILTDNELKLKRNISKESSGSNSSLSRSSSDGGESMKLVELNRSKSENDRSEITINDKDKTIVSQNDQTVDAKLGESKTEGSPPGKSNDKLIDEVNDSKSISEDKKTIDSDDKEQECNSGPVKTQEEVSQSDVSATGQHTKAEANDVAAETGTDDKATDESKKSSEANVDSGTLTGTTLKSTSTTPDVEITLDDCHKKQEESKEAAKTQQSPESKAPAEGEENITETGLQKEEVKTTKCEETSETTSDNDATTSENPTEREVEQNCKKDNSDIDSAKIDKKDDLLEKDRNQPECSEPEGKSSSGDVETEVSPTDDSGSQKDISDESMELKIVAAFSLDGEDYTKTADQKENNNKSEESKDMETEGLKSTDQKVDSTVAVKESKSETEKTQADTSNVVIDVFKDGRIAVINANESSTAPEQTSLPKEKTQELPSKLHQSKLGQLLTAPSISTGSISSGLASMESTSAGKAATPSATTSANSAATTTTTTLSSVTSSTCSTANSATNVPSTSVSTSSKPPGAPPGITAAQMKHARNPNFYVCGLTCNFSCLNSVDFRDHLFLAHAGEKSFPCYYCGFLAHTEESLLRHITNHAHSSSKTATLYMCGTHRCRFGSNMLSDLLNHMQILHSDVNMYVCKECNETFSGVKELVSHFEDNFIHVVNCPHCACKGTDRRMILKHIAEYHPGKAKMVSVAKQIICRDRKEHHYKQVHAMYKSGNSNVLGRVKAGESLVTSEKRIVSSSYTGLKKTDQTKTVTVKEEKTTNNDSSAPQEKQIQAQKCQHCTFVARDQTRLESHIKCHGLPVAKRHRFRCMYCPQGFDVAQKFQLHVNCHPGLIKYWMYYCKRCDFDTNQRFVMLRHIRTRDELHFNVGNEEDMFSVVEKIIESRVLECEHCNYQTRHRLHLQIHYQREHKGMKTTASSPNDKSKPKAFNQPTQPSSDSLQENASKKFKCPFCRYLVPKAADLKSHVKKHANLGKITIDFLRCRYCSLSSTARNIVYDHIREKHPGKSLVLVRKIVTIDCSGSDNTFSETSVTEDPLTVTPSSSCSPGRHGIDKFQCETCSFATVDRREFDSHVQLHNTTKGGIHSMAMDDGSDEEEDDECEGTAGVDHPQPDAEEDESKPKHMDMIEQVYVIPEAVAGDQLSSPARCCSCYYASGYRSGFIEHMTTNHQEVMLVVRNKGTTVEQMCPNGKMFFGLPATLNNEILLVPDRQVFTQAVKCPKCPNFATYFRRNLVLHLSKDHSEITAMGKCTWPGWQASSGGSSVTQQPEDSKKNILKKEQKHIPSQDESCIIGSGDLDEQIGCLYKNYGDRQQCLICNSQKPKKFFMHIHILRHLNIYLMKCPYCPHKGLQKYKVGRHIRIVHPEEENIVKEIKVDIQKKVAEFLAQQKKVVNAAVSSPPVQNSASTLLSPSSVSPSSDSIKSNKLSGPLGTPDLDSKLLCLYTNVGGKNKCNLCSVEFARKYAIHRHIVVNHLKVALLKCGHCDFQGVEKHVIIDHILEQHKNQHIRFEPLNINMAEKVREYLNTYNIVKEEPEAEEKFAPTYSSPPRLSGPQSYCLGKDKLHNKLSCLFVKKGESFKCRLCNWKFPRKYAIHRHLLMKHMKIGLYGCTHCHVQGAERYIVISHMKEAHPKVPPQARMLEIDMDQRIQEVLQEAALGKGNHFAGRRPKSYSTDSESTTFPSVQEEAEVDVKKEDQTQMVVAMFGKKRKPSPEPIPKEEESGVVTPKKLKTTSRMVDVTSRIKVVCVQDGNFKKFVCEKCRFTSLHRSNVYRHVLRIHEKYRELQCARCGYKTFSRVLLDQHIEVEHEGIERPSFTDSQSESPNIKQEPKLEEDNFHDVPDPSTSDEPVKHYACAYCNFETNTAENIIKHTRENHAPGSDGSSPEMDQPTKSEAEVTVSILGNVVKKSSVKRGTFTESQMLYCGYCTFKAPGVQALKDHHKDKHQPNKLCIISPQQWRYICRVCGLKNNAGSKMRCHLNRHLEYRPFTCSSCSQGYASTDELRKHIRNLHHSEQIQYLKHEKKEQKINRFLEESRKNAMLVNIGAPPGEESMGPLNSVVDQMESPKTKLPPPEPKYKGIKRTMKMPMSPAKSLKLKKKYWMAGIDRESKAMTRDIACNWCDIPHTVSVDQMKQHHTKAHPDKEFLWVDTRSGNTCTATGEVRVAGTLLDIPKMDELHTKKQLANKKMKYYCTRCSFSAWYLPAMVSHCRCHLPKKHLCAYCHLRYSNKEYLHKHQDTFHPGRDSWVLSMETGQGGGSATVTSAEAMETAVSEQAPAPLEERRVSQSIMYCCNFCPFENESLYQYRLHLPAHGKFKYLVTDLGNDSPLKCGFCPFIAQDQVDFSLHISTHFENRTYKCGYCNYSAYTRAHVRFHCQNQHRHLEMKVLDLSSAASYVEDLKAEKTNLPKLVDLDPRVTLKDIKFMSQSDLESSMSEAVQRRVIPSDEDEFVDVEKVDDDVPKALIPQSKENASKSSNEAASVEPQNVHSSLEPVMTSEVKKTEVTEAVAKPDRNESPGVVSSSVGTDGDGFDMAEVSAFVDESTDNSKLEKSDSLVDSDGNKSLNISGVKLLDDSDTPTESQTRKKSSDEVDGGQRGPTVKASTPVKDTAERSQETEDSGRKDDSGNVFDTLQSWLQMK